MYRYLRSSFSILIRPSYVQSQILYECNFDNATLNEKCFTTDVLLISNFAFLIDQPLDHPASDVTSTLKPMNNGQVCQLPYKAELNNINVTSEQYLIYYYYISNISQKRIPIIKEVDGTNETIDFVTSSHFNGWTKHEILFNATESGYKIYFDLQKTSSEISLFHIALDEISI
ncbi:unnamed protein product [Rotaria socialis]